MKLLIIGNPRDLHVMQVVKKLRKNIRVAYADVDLWRAYGGDRASAAMSKSGDYSLLGLYDLSKMDKIWLRRYNSYESFEKRGILDSYIKDEYTNLVKGMLMSQEENKIFPRYLPNELNRNKTWQLYIAKKSGFIIPETVLGSNVDLLIRTFKETDELAVKSINRSSVRLETEQVAEIRHLSFPTRKVTLKQLLSERDRYNRTPVIVQKYVDKKYELRITVVASQIFACAIDTQANPLSIIDSRGALFKNIKHWQVNLPKVIVNKINKFMKLSHMNFACIDMIVTPDDEYIFLEANPNGQWLWIERETGMKISDAIADMLAC